jgi:hypothetical protein
VSFCARILDRLDVKHLSAALNMLAVRFQEINGEPEQCVDVSRDAAVKMDVSNAADVDEAVLERRLYDDTVGSFDTTKAPLGPAGVTIKAITTCTQSRRARIYRLRGRPLLLVFRPAN